MATREGLLAKTEAGFPPYWEELCACLPAGSPPVSPGNVGAPGTDPPGSNAGAPGTDYSTAIHSFSKFAGASRTETPQIWGCLQYSCHNVLPCVRTKKPTFKKIFWWPKEGNSQSSIRRAFCCKAPCRSPSCLWRQEWIVPIHAGEIIIKVLWSRCLTVEVL